MQKKEKSILPLYKEELVVVTPHNEVISIDTTDLYLLTKDTGGMHESMDLKSSNGNSGY